MRLVFAAVVLVLVGCKIDLSNVKVGSSSDNKVSVDLTCQAVANGGLAVDSGESVAVLVSVSGSFGPFSSSEIFEEFSGSAEVFRSYKNDTDGAIKVRDSIHIKDGKGFEKSCDFEVTVLPAAFSDLVCVLTSDRSVVSTGEKMTLTMTAAGGKKPYAYSDLSHTGTTGESLTTRSDIHATAAISFSVGGVKTVSAKVTDADGTIQMCSTSLEVGEFHLPVLPPCEVSTYFNPSFIGESVVVSVAAGISLVNGGPAVLVDVRSTWNSEMEVYGRWSNHQAEIAFYNSGIFPVVATLEYILSGRQVSCSTMHRVFDWY